ncbi:MAG: DNA-3-methyladenine glycosylase [Bacillota bacterium]|nr:DNA-3-methyladenine glycosylase [Bacillota bacterium]
MKKLRRKFYNRDTLIVAKELLGKYIIYKKDNCEYIVKIVETEAYMGIKDKACHSYNNKKTKRNEIMYGNCGILYVYLIYGMYYCANIVTREKDVPEAVLIRAAEPVKGLENMSTNRYGKDYNELNKKEITGLTNGPGKLCKALGIDKLNNGDDLCSYNIYLAEGEHEEFEICSSSRINIDYAEEYKDCPWRFYIKDNLYVSKK